MGVEPGGAAQSDGVPRALGVGLALLLAARVAYHIGYLSLDPFALVTFSDGQLYEEAARDILAHAPLGSRPLYLQGLYAYLLALGMSAVPEVVSGLVLQLAVAALALGLFHAAATRAFGRRAGALSSLVLLAGGSLAFYENKYLSVSLGVSCNVLVLWTFARALDAPSARRVALVGVATGLSVLGRPNLLLAIPFVLAALWVGTRRAAGAIGPLWPRRVVFGFAAGLLLALSPMALRNLIVVGRADVLPSHGGGIPFYIGNNPHANARWNTAGGLLSGQVYAEPTELAARLSLTAGDPAELDALIGAELTARAFRYIASDPLGWLALEGKKLTFMLGNHEFVRDYDRLGEAELLGVRIDAVGLPFGCTLGLGVIGFGWLWRRARHGDDAQTDTGDTRDSARAWAWLLGGQLAAIAAANLLVFTSAQNRVPLVVPLSFVAGPALIELSRAWRARSFDGWTGGRALAIAAALATAQAFIPRAPAQREPSSVHSFNLAVVLEVLGRHADAATSYGRAARKDPQQPVFALRHARALRLSGSPQAARKELERVQALGALPPELARELQHEARSLQAGSAAP